MSRPPGSRRVLSRAVGALILVGAAAAMAVTVWQWEYRPRTDDATGAPTSSSSLPQANGHIVDLPIHDDQQVQKGELLFVVDPRPYEIALERARAALALTRKEVAALGKAVGTADAGVTRATAQLAASAADVTRRETDPVAADAKYRPDFPDRFGAYEDAETFCQQFFPGYNTEHRHGALGLMTPHDIHYGLAAAKLGASG